MKRFCIAAVMLWSALAAHAQSGWGLAPDGHGGFVFCDLIRDQVWRLDAQGHATRIATQTHCHNLVPGYDGNAYGEDIGAESRAGAELSLWRLTSEGERSYILGPSTDPDPGIWLVRDAAGKSYAWDGNPRDQGPSRILERAPSGEVTVLAGSVWGSADGHGAEARFTAVGGMAAAADGTVYVVDSGAVRSIRPDGTVTTLARGAVSNATGGLPFRGGLWNHSMGVAVDLHRNIYIVDYARRSIVRVDPDGHVTKIFQSSGWANALTRNGWGWRPVGIASIDGEMFVLEDWPLPGLAADLIGSPRLSRLHSDGRREEIARIASKPVRAIAAVTFLLLAALPILALRRRK